MNLRSASFMQAGLEGRIRAAALPATLALAVASLVAAPGAFAEDVPTDAPTFNRDVLPLLQANCQECHRAGQLAPMSFETYAETRPWAKSIRQSVSNMTMPPWHADRAHGTWANDIGLSDAEIDAFVRWVDAGAPEGDPADKPPARVWSDSPWKAGEPDVALVPDRAFPVPVTDRDEDIYQCIVVPTNFEHDTWIAGVEYKVDEARVVHHMIGLLDTTGKARALDAETPEPGFHCGMVGSNFGGGLDSGLGGWAPGMPPNIYSPGVGKLIKAGTDIVLQMHYYNQTGEAHEDRSGIGLHFAEGTIRQQGRIMPVSAFNIRIPAGDPNAEHKARWRVPRDIEITSLMPHMHFIGKDMTISAQFPDGTVRTLLSVPRYDFNWQTVYVPAERIRLPKGTTVHVVGHHDNSAENPNNPSNPPQDVTWGESTTEEMMIGWVGYVNAGEDLNITPGPNGRAPESAEGSDSARADEPSVAEVAAR